MKSVIRKCFQNFVNDTKEIGRWFDHSNLETFLYIGIILLFFKIEGNILEEKD